MITIIDCPNCVGTGEVSECVSSITGSEYVQDSVETPCNVSECEKGRIEVDTISHYDSEISSIECAIEQLKRKLKSDNCNEIDTVVKNAIEWLIND